MDGGMNMNRISTSDLSIENDESVNVGFDDAREQPNSQIPPNNRLGQKLTLLRMKKLERDTT